MIQAAAELRQLVTARANRLCEYCLYPQELALFDYEIVPIIAPRYGGGASIENLALACPFCVQAKGEAYAYADPESGRLTGLYNPRTQNWREHFGLDDAVIVANTACGRVTVLALQMNRVERAAERAQLIAAGLSPYALRADKD